MKMNLSHNRKDTIKKMVRNYHDQVKIVRKTSLSLHDYLTNIGLSKTELKYAINLKNYEL